MAIRQAAARTSRSGRMNSDTATASPATSSSPTDRTCPAVPRLVSRCPGSRLVAGVLYLVRPSGNSTVSLIIAASAAGRYSVAGASTAISTSAAASSASTNRTAARRPSRDQYSAAMTGIASQAVSFSTHAAASAAPAQRVRRLSPDRAARASESSMNASTGGSVVITARLSAMIGDATAIAVSASARRDPARSSEALTQSAAPSTMIVPTAIHSPAFPANPCSPAACGRPNTIISGRYGL
jgi:hypothetical protein